MTWTEYVAIVNEHLHVNAKRRGLNGPLEFNQRMMRNAVADLQRHIVSYQNGNTTTYALADLTEEGYASRGIMPPKAIPEAFHIVWTALDADGESQERCQRNRLSFLPWVERNLLTCCSHQCLYAYSIAPDNRTFLIHPVLNDETELLLSWRGIKLDYVGGDVVPFPEESALAVGHYLSAYIALNVNNDRSLFEVNWGLWIKAKCDLYKDEMEKVTAEKKDNPYGTVVAP